MINPQKIAFKFLDIFAPSVAAQQVYKVLSNPRIRKMRGFEEEVLDRATKEIIPFKGFSIQTYSWGEPGRKTVFMIHGWEGQAGNFGGLVDILLEKGYQVKAFDGPSHGHSSKGETSMFDFAELATELLRTYRPDAIISHSFGSVTSMITLSQNQDIPIEKWLMVTTPHNFKDRLNDVKDMIGARDKTIDKVIHLLEGETNMQVDEMNMEYYADQVGHVKDIVITHSRTDKIIHINSARITHTLLPQSKLIELNELGHYSILWSEQLKEIVEREF